MAEAQERYCSSCGHELSSDDRFCPNCGNPVHCAARVSTVEADVPVTPPLPTGNTSVAIQEQEAQNDGQPVSRPLTWRYVLLVILLAGFGIFIFLALLTSFGTSIPFLARLGPVTGATVTLALLYLFNVPFGLVLGYSRPSGRLSVYVPFGLAVGLAQFVGGFVWFAFRYENPTPNLVVYGIVPALIFSSAAIAGDLAKKGQLSLNATVLTSVIGLVSAVVGLIAAVVSIVS